MHTPQILDKHDHPISVGDTVYCPFRGGKHEGKVEAIITGSSSHQDIETRKGDEAAKKEAEKTINPPKVLFHDQKGRRKEHRPGALSDLDKDTGEELERDMARPIGQRPAHHSQRPAHHSDTDTVAAREAVVEEDAGL